MALSPNDREADASVLIPAAGDGDRLGLGPKGLLELAGQPLIVWLTRKLAQLSDDVIVAAPPRYLAEFRELCPDCRCIAGGASRQESVARLLAQSSRDWVMLSDVARPFVTLDLCRAVLASARETGAAGAVLDPDVPVARVVDGKIARAFQREEAGILQAPNAFSRSLLAEVYRQAELGGWQAQSTLELALRANREVAAVPGEKTNIKLTTAEDWSWATLLTEFLQ
jgi:2-C-methyl-D-erythritol 4-phosphate cytidylyltransferase